MRVSVAAAASPPVIWSSVCLFAPLGPRFRLLLPVRTRTDACLTFAPVYKATLLPGSVFGLSYTESNGGIIDVNVILYLGA